MISNILIVDDEKSIREMLLTGLSTESGYQLFEAEDAMTAKHILSEHTIDLILLDWMLPNINGINFVHQIRKIKSYQNIGVIMLTAKGDGDDIVSALDAGADDFVTKPFSFNELTSRMNALLRRLSSPPSNVINKEGNADLICFEKIKIDHLKRQVFIEGQAVDFSPTEFDLLFFFATHADRVCSRQQILNHVWGENVYIDERTVDVHIRRIRHLLDAYQCSHLIKTVRGVGYRFSISD